MLYVAFATAAVLLVLAGLGAWWTTRSRTANPSQSAGAAPATSPAAVPPAPQAPAAAAPRVIAFALSPIATRSETSSEPLIVPAGTDVVALDLGMEPRKDLQSARAVVTTVGGDRSWTGSAVPVSGASGARVEVPAAQLRPDDYIVTLYARERGVERELHRYFLRVRAR
jgi:hypothetical protein